MKTTICGCGEPILLEDDVNPYTFTVQWHCNNCGSVHNDGRVLSHFILNPEPGFLIDHKDGNKHNNLRSNLRQATRSQNGYNRGKMKNNTSGYKGVYFNKVHKNNPWSAKIRVNKVLVHVLSSDNPRDCAIAYNEAAKTLHGEFAFLNQID